MSQSLYKAIPNAILRPITPLAYISLQHTTTEDGVWIMLKHILRKISPHLGGKVVDMQKQIFDMREISSKDLDYYINRAAILHKNIFLSIQYFYPKFLFEQILTQIMVC